jgi:phosphoglycerate kinase
MLCKLMFLEKSLKSANLIYGVYNNNPAGVFEDRVTELGTKTLLTAIATSGSFSALGGGDTITALNKYGLLDKMSYVSTGGGALVRYLSGEELPVIKALKKSAKSFNIK